MAPQELQSERAMLSAFAYDLLLIGPYLWVALQVGSLTIMGEVVRGALLITVGIISLITLRKIHRGQTGGYDFGMGKMEQILSLCVAVLLTASMIFIWIKLMNRSPSGTQQVSFVNYLAIGLAFANLCANLAPIPPLYKAMKFGKSVLVTTQFRAKIAKSIGSVVVTLCVALNQLTSNGALALWAERVGVVFVTLVTLHAAYELIKSSLPDLLDHTLSEDLQVKINQVLARHYDNYDALKWCRSRQSGASIEVYVGLGFAGDMVFAQVARITKAVVDDIEASIPRSRVIVTPVVAD
jgi:ferrous-iron efflux pump FieF